MRPIVLPWPGKPLSPNFRSRSHWPRTRALKASRAAGTYATLASDQIAPEEGDIWVETLFIPPDRRDRDRDNLLSSCKGYFDGIADGLKVNDRRFRFLPARIGEPSRDARVEVRIRHTGEARAIVDVAIDVVLNAPIKSEAA
jgi:crossover junction endodeoxyribonuclease RusA